jgi:hypothetical protein
MAGMSPWRTASYAWFLPIPSRVAASSTVIVNAAGAGDLFGFSLDIATAPLLWGQMCPHDALWRLIVKGTLVSLSKTLYTGKEQRGAQVMPRRKGKDIVAAKIRLASSVVEQLEAAAKKRRHSFNAEAAIRLGNSFMEEKIFGGEAGRTMLHFIATAFVLAGERYYRDHSPTQKTSLAKGADVSLWIDEPKAHGEAVISAMEQLMLHQPHPTSEKCMLQIRRLTGRIASRFLSDAMRDQQETAADRKKHRAEG